MYENTPPTKKKKKGKNMQMLHSTLKNQILEKAFSSIGDIRVTPHKKRITELRCYEEDGNGDSQDDY